MTAIDNRPVNMEFPPEQPRQFPAVSLVRGESGLYAAPNLDESDKLWRPSYGVYDRELTLARYDVIVEQAKVNTNASTEEINAGYHFIETAFDAYEGKTYIEPASFAFTVPTRTSASDGVRNGQFAQEIAPFMPILNHENLGVKPFFLSRWGTSLPPTVIERYNPNSNGDSGVVLYAPISPDIAEMYDPQNPTAVFALARKIVNDAVEFADRRLHADAIGLGATLPSLTNLGRSIKTDNPNLLITTGHAGTVHLIAETAQRLLSDYIEYDGKFGIIGTGAIGSASAQALLDRYPDATFVVNDTKPENIERLCKLIGANKVRAVATAKEVVESTNTIVSAVTSDFQLPEGDYRGKAFIEDSMPTCAPQKTIEAGGGIVAWVIGDDHTQQGILTPQGLWEDNGYRFGGSFAESTNTFGCAAEVAVVHESHDPTTALRRGVKPSDVRRIGELFERFGIVAAGTQRAGQFIVPNLAA